VRTAAWSFRGHPAAKKGAKGKKVGGAKPGGKGGGGAASGGGKVSGGAAGPGRPGVTAEGLAAQLPGWFPDLEWDGESGGGEAERSAAVATLLLPGAVASYEQALQVRVPLYDRRALVTAARLPGRAAHPTQLPLRAPRSRHLQGASRLQTQH
jgi:hypothetical protein